MFFILTRLVSIDSVCKLQKQPSRGVLRAAGGLLSPLWRAASQYYVSQFLVCSANLTMKLFLHLQRFQCSISIQLCKLICYQIFSGATDRILISILKRGCYKLKSIDLTASWLLTDISMSLIGKWYQLDNETFCKISFLFLKNNFSLRNWKNVTHFRPTFLYPLKNLWFTVSMEHGQGALTQVTFYTCNPFQANVFISPEKSLVYGIYGAWTGSIDPSYPSYAFMIYDQFMIYFSVETIW